MKKLISLLLCLALAITCIASLASAVTVTWEIPADDDGTRRLDNADKPAEVTGCEESEAVWKLTLGDGREMFFKQLTSSEFMWAGWQNCDRTFTLLKDTAEINALNAQEEWRNVPMTTIDLNGGTVTSKAATFYKSGFDAHLTIKNGTVIHTGKTTFANIGNHGTFVVADRYGWPCTQELIFDNVTVYSESANLVTNYQWQTSVIFKNATVYTAGTGIVGTKSSADHAKYEFEPWTGSYDCKVIIEDSTVGCGSGAFVKADDAIRVEVKNSTIVAESTLDAPGGTITEGGTETTYTGTVAGNAVTGKAFTFVTKVPATDVPDTTVPTTGVSIAALSILATLSLAGAAVCKKKH